MILPAWQQWAAAGAIGLAVGWTANGWRLGEQLAETETAAEHERAEAFRYVLAEQDKSAQAMAQADRDATKRLSDAKQKTDQLAGCIAAGNGCGLRVRVVRSACVPEADATTSVGDRGGEWAELGRSTALDILRLESAVRTAQEALALCVSEWPK